MVPLQQLQRLSGQACIGRIAEDEGRMSMPPPLLHRGAEEVALKIAQVVPLLDRAPNGGQADGGLIADGEAELQRAVVGVLHQATRAGLLDRDPNPAVEVGIGRAVHRREIVEILLGVIERPQPIQRLGMIAGQDDVGFIGRTRQQRAFHARRRRLEIIGAARAHLVEVDLDVGPPLVEHLQLGRRLPLSDGQPIAVQIGEIVVGATGRKGLDMLLVERIADWRIAGPGIVPVGGAVAAVGVLHRVDQDDRLVQPIARLRVAPRH